MLGKSVLLSFLALEILLAIRAAEAAEIGQCKLDEGAGATAFDSPGAGSQSE